MKKFLMLLLFVSLTFSAWGDIAVVSLLASLSMLVILFMLGVGLGINELKFLASEEVYQWIMTAVMLGGFASIEAFSAELSEALGEGDSIGDTSLTIVDGYLNEMNEGNDLLVSLSVDVGRESARSGFCSINYFSLYLSGCSAYRPLMPPISVSLQAISFASVELNSLYLLLEIGVEYAFLLLLPLGILLRTFKFTRGAGAFFIALAVAFYFVLPFGVIFMNELIDISVDSSGIDTDFTDLRVRTCDPYLIPPEDTENEEDAIALLSDMEGNLSPLMFLILIKGSLLPIVAVLSAISSLRWLTALGGAEIDVSALSRIA